jgi:hypothetical protein
MAKSFASLGAIGVKTTSAAASSAATLTVPPADPKSAPKPPAVPSTEECKAFRAGSRCKFSSGCRDPRCKAEQAKSAKSSAPAKAAAAGGDGSEVAKLRKEVADLTGLVKAGFEKQSKQTSTLSDTVVAGFASQKEAENRLQRSIEAMMGGIGSLAKTLEGGIASSRSTAALPALPAPETYVSARRPPPALPALPAPESSSAPLTNFANVAARLKDCPLNSAVKSLIPTFVRRYPSIDQDALACLLLAILSGKKKTDLTRMGEFTKTMVLPLLTQTNLAIFKKFFEELALNCRKDSCVKVNNSSGGEFNRTFHLLGKEETDIMYLIQILLEEV